MNFTVRYRSAAGGLKAEVVDAANRAEVFAQMKARGIVPMSVEAGARSESGSGMWRSPAWMKGLIAGVVVVLLAGGVWFLTARKGGAVEEVQPERLVKSDKVKAVKKPAPVRTETPENPVEQTVQEVVTEKPDFQANYPRTPGHLPLPGGNVVTFTPPAPGCTAEVFTVGGLYLCDSEGNFVKYEPPRLFDNRFENTIESLAMNTRLLLTDHAKNFSDSEIAIYLARPITINADDAPDIVARKTATAAMKEEIKAFIKDGGSYREYVDKLHQQIGTERVLHREAMREMVGLLSEGDVEGARMYHEQINKYLSDKGFLGLKLHEAWQRQLDGRAEDDEANDAPANSNTEE